MIQLKRILVPTDFSDSSQAGLNCGCELAARFSAELQLLHVSGRWDVEQSVYPKLAEFQNEAEQGARTQLEELQRRVGVNGSPWLALSNPESRFYRSFATPNQTTST